ncbi:hypothetical protein ACRAKI_09390 [Saccharothrix isguenensis]
MDPTTLVAAARRFPLLGRPRPACPSLVRRVQEVADIAHKAGQAGTDGLAEGAHALNKAALIASDCGVPSLARDLCWQHIDLYRVAADRPLTVLQARYMLEPVLNLARLQIRASDGEQALHLLTAMHRAVMSKADLDVDGQTLPLTDLTGTRQEHHKLREWVWLHLVGDGIRALTLAGRWDDAVAHAQAHRGVGLHLMEGRQATIVAHCLDGAGAAAIAALAESTPVQPWELQVASCLKVMCAHAADVSARRDVYAMIGYFVGHEPMPGYAAFRAQLGLTVTTLAAATDPEAADSVLAQVADEVIKASDGYAARDVLRHRDTQANLPNEQREALSDLLVSSGLGSGTLLEHLLKSLLDSAQAAARVVGTSLSQQDDPAMRA